MNCPENERITIDMNNVILIGMPGVGKSTIGIVLAKVLGYDFIDSDLLIQKSEGKLLWQIMRDAGNDEFNRIAPLSRQAAASSTARKRWSICAPSEL